MNENMSIDTLKCSNGTTFSVPCVWLHNLFRKWVREEYADTKYENDTEFLEGCADNDYENINEDTADEVLKIAIHDGVVVKIFLSIS